MRIYWTDRTWVSSTITLDRQGTRLKEMTGVIREKGVELTDS